MEGKILSKAFPDLNLVPTPYNCPPAVPPIIDVPIILTTSSLRDLSRDIAVWLVTTKDPTDFGLMTKYPKRKMDVCHVLLVFEGLGIIISTNGRLKVNTDVMDILFPFFTWSKHLTMSDCLYGSSDESPLEAMVPWSSDDDTWEFNDDNFKSI